MNDRKHHDRVVQAANDLVESLELTTDEKVIAVGYGLELFKKAALKIAKNSHTREEPPGRRTISAALAVALQTSQLYEKHWDSEDEHEDFDD